ncbi:MAG: SpoIIE family protein phosphatase [Ruminococcus sp.]|nr:SpoIIE family protein phosphatase [Ruminococcus sp.]
MRKSIFFKLALLILLIIFLLDAAVLIISYQLTYNNQVNNTIDKLRRAALTAVTYMEIDYPVTEEDCSTCSDYFDTMCYSLDITYVYAVYPYVESNQMIYIAIGFGDNAAENARSERYSGVEVHQTLSNEMIEAYHGKTGGVIEHYENQYGETLSCYMPVTVYYNSQTKEFESPSRTAVVGAEQNISEIVRSIQKRFLVISIFTILLSMIIVAAIFLILYFRISRPIRRISRKMNSFVSDREAGFIELPVKGSDELAEMSRAFNSMTHEIDSYLLNIDKLNKEKHMQAAELDIARSIQKGLLKPASYRSKNAVINACMLAAKNVGGDLYDYLMLDDGKICLTIADVSGKGVSAALFMSRAITLLHQYAILGYSPAQTLKAYNDTLAEQNPNTLFITTFVAVYDPATRELRYANAGHNLPYILSDTLTTLDGAQGMAAGIFSSEDYEEASVTLKEGDVLFLYTDGVNEAEDKDGGFYGTDALEAELSRHLAGDADHLVDDVLEKIRLFTDGADQSDDITILTMQVASPIHRELTLPAEVENLTVVTELIQQEETLSDDTKDALYLIAEEMFVNICSYAYRGKKGAVTVALDIDPASAALTFTDSGEPFDPTSEVIDIEEYDHENSIGGLGRFLSFSLADDFSYRYEGNKNILTIKKKMM